MEEKLYKASDPVPAAGKYICTVCGLVIEYTQAHIDNGAVFGVCSLCLAGSEDGPKKPHEDFWKAL